MLRTMLEAPETVGLRDRVAAALPHYPSAAMLRISDRVRSLRPSSTLAVDARFKAMRASSVKPRRCKPTLFNPYSLSGLPAALTKGGTSFITAADPPTNACRPMRTN